MKKNIRKIIFLIFILINYCNVNKVYAKHVTGLNIPLDVSWINISYTFETSSEGEERCAEMFHDYLGYVYSPEGTKKVNKEIKLDTTIRILKKSLFGNKYTIQIGKEKKEGIMTYRATIKNISEEDLKEIYGCPDPTNKDISWSALIIASTKTKTKSAGIDGVISYEVTINEIYNNYETNDLEKGRNENISSTSSYSEGTTAGDVSGAIHSATSLVKQYTQWQKKFGKEPGGYVAKDIVDFFRILADIAQTTIDKVETTKDGIPGLDFSIVYTYKELSGEDNSSNSDSEFKKVDYSVLNKYTQVGEEDANADKIIENNVDKFKKSTQIPAIPIDIYAIANQKIDFFSVDFMGIYKKDSKVDGWNSLKKIFTTITHIVIYISLAIMLMALIYYSINIVISINGNPVDRVSYINGISRFITSLVILVSVIFIMALCIIIPHYLIEILNKNNTTSTDKLPIRISVNGVYSFSTNLTGYLRFMSDSENISHHVAYTVEYIVVVIMNIIMWTIMIYRMVKMWILGMIGPAIAAANALNINEKVKFRITLKDWAKSYAILAFIQVEFIIAYKIVEQTFGFTK